jgi:hypothetical protein
MAMALVEHVMAAILAAAIGVRPGQPVQPGETPQDVDARLLADLEVIRMLDMLRDLDALRQMDEMMGPARAERKARPGKDP